MLGPVDLEKYLNGSICEVACSGELGINVRPLDYEWVLDVRCQCMNKGIPFQFHQTGAYFIKDGRMYHIPRRFQAAQARKAGIDYKIVDNYLPDFQAQNAYFDSITYENMMKRIGKLRIKNEDMEMVSLLAKACFYQDRLPLGFTSSPVLSDLYLVTLDRKNQKNKQITYTRYADDFIISAAGPEANAAIAAFRLQIEKDLDALDLELNRKKTYLRQLKMPGDAIHVLGMNIVRTEDDANRITISDRYVRETCKVLCDWITNTASDKNPDEFARIYGRVCFIRQCSRSSYDKLRKMVKIKCGYNGLLSAKALK